MSKRKKFSIGCDIKNGLNDIISAVDNNAGNFRYDVVSLSRIETDPENPRELMLSVDDIKNGLQINDPDIEIKKKEKSELLSLSSTISESGLINPIVVYKRGDHYRLVAGERRYLASLLAGKSDIHARILPNKPDNMNLRLLQWIENNEREDLSLKERLSNLQSIASAYCEENSVDRIKVSEFMKLMSLSKGQAVGYLSVLYGPKDLKEEIALGNIASLEKASLLAGIKDDRTRKLLIEACVKGCNLTQLKKFVNNAKQTKKDAALMDVKKPGRAQKYVNLGKIEDTTVVKKIVDIVIGHPDYKHYSSIFEGIHWDNHAAVSRVFHKFIRLLGGSNNGE